MLQKTTSEIGFGQVYMDNVSFQPSKLELGWGGVREDDVAGKNIQNELVLQND